MITLLHTLRMRNEAMFYFSAALTALGLVFYALSQTTTLQVAGVNAWYKPFKFALSIAIYCATMGWLCYELPNFDTHTFNVINILLFSFELGYITLQAARGQESHFNWSTPVYRLLFGGMAIAAVGISLYTAYVGWLFCTTDLPLLPGYYVWAIRLGIGIFVVFSLEGILMGGRQTHTVGVLPQTTFLPFMKWNMTEGDLRVAHFIGMHALQVLPLLSWYLLRDTRAVWIVAALYLLCALFVLIQALHARPFFTDKKYNHAIHQTE